MRSESSSKFLMESLKFVSSACSFAGRALSGIIFVVINDSGKRGRTISVANRVQRFSLRGKGISVMASKTELLPDNWSPQATSCSNGTMSSMPHSRKESTTFSTFCCSALCRASSDAIVAEIGDSIGVDLRSIGCEETSVGFD